MTKATLAFFACVAATALYAQDLAPELAPLVAKHKADQAAVEAQKSAALARLQQAYEAVLDGAEKAATTAGALEVVAAIAKEREALKSGLMAPAFPESLPKTLQAARKVCLDGIVRVSADQGPRRKAIDADYLRALAALQSRAAGNAELAKQVAAEKANLLASVSAGTSAGDPKPAAANSRNVVVNGTFDVVDTEGHPLRWRFFGTSGADVCKVARGENPVLRMTVGNVPQSLGAIQTIEVPPSARTVLIRGRVHGKATDHKADDSNSGANIAAQFVVADDHPMDGPDKGWKIAIGGHDGGWKTLTKTFPVQSGAKLMEIACISWWVAGTFDFDDIEVEFH
jgi:hypothetical protein